MRALVLGFDGLAPARALPWAQAGVLPSLGRLLREGVWGWLDPVAKANSAAAWSSFVTGLEPGKHGILDYTTLVPGTYCVRDLNGSQRLGDPFWRRLGNLGYRTGVVNVPMMYPAEPLKGFAVAGRDAPAPQSSSFSYPPTFFGRISHRVQRSYCIEAEVDRFAAQQQWDTGIHTILECLEARREFALCALEEEVPGLLLVVFAAADAAHRLLSDRPGSQAPTPQTPKDGALGNVVQQIYQRLDKALAELTRKSAPEVVVVICGPGKGSNERRERFLLEWLRTTGLLHTRSRWDPRHRLSNLVMRARTAFQKLPAGAKPVPALKCVDWERTQAYCIGTGDIYINLQGRDPQGSVPKSRYERLCQDIIEQLQEIADPAANAPAIEGAVMGRDVYDVPSTSRVPDILIQWQREKELNGQVPDHTPGSAQITSPLTKSRWRQSLFLAAGSGIRQGARVQGARITDLAPTLLHLFGDTVPDSMDGHVVLDIFDPEWLAMHPVMTERRTVGGKSKSETLVDDTVMVEERLRSLGYIQ